MRIKEGYILRNVANTYIIVPSAALDPGKIVSINESGAFLWERLLSGTDREGLIRSLLAEYEVPEDIAAEDIDLFLGALRNIGALEE